MKRRFFSFFSFVLVLVGENKEISVENVIFFSFKVYLNAGVLKKGNLS